MDNSCKECPRNLEKFVDLDKCQQLIEDIHIKLSDGQGQVETNRSESEKLVETFRKTIDFYQEQPELLEPCLADLILKLTNILRDLDSRSCKYHVVFKFLYQLIKVNGFKNIGKRFPHEADKLPLLVDLLGREDPQDRSNWQTRFVLTVWLSIAILTPFDLVKYSSDGDEMSDKIYSTLLKNLTVHDSCQHATAFCLAKFSSRPDVIKSNRHLSEIIKTSMQELTQVKHGSANSMDDVRLIGYLRTLSYMFKFLPRAELKRRCPEVVGVLIGLDVDKINRELVNHLIIKLVQRVGLALLPMRVAPWRYKRGSRILGQISDHPSSERSGAAAEQVAEDEVPANNIEEVTSAEHIESILGVLFTAVQNSQTKIRWSAAKGIARLASRLSRERARDVINMVVGNFFNEDSSEFAWHGGCLTLAEMARHGLIMEEKLEAVTRIISNAIVYDKIKGSFAVGAHVREGACYVVWAMARTYEDHLLAPYISSISVNLLCTMLFDRELQCRRAASATFQELVGRQGTFSEEGIDILTKVDYQNVGQRLNTYVQLAMQVASYGERYSRPFVDHLLCKKLGHWDIQIRRLASDSLSALMLHINKEYVQAEMIPRLLEEGVQDADTNAKHGAILGLAKVIKGLVPLQFTFDEKLIEFVGNIVKICDRQLKSKQKAPNFIEAIGCIIQSAELASFKFNDDSDTLKQWESITLSALDSDNANLRDIGSECLKTLYRSYYKTNKTSQDRLLTTLNNSLRSLNESSRCGGLRALEKLGQVVGASSVAGGELVGGQPNNIRTDAETPDIILTSLTSYIAKETREKTQDIVFAQAKAEACDAFVNFCRSLDKTQLILSTSFLSAGYGALLDKTEDYTFDRRGDIGVVVRRGAIKALCELTLHLVSIGFTSWLFDPETRLVEKLISRTLQQCVSYNDTARELAAVSFYKLLAAISELDENQIPHTKEILNSLNEHQVNDEFNWRDEAAPIFVNLLAKSEYSIDLWTGLIPNVGQVSDLCAKQSRDALSNYLQSLSELNQVESRNFVLDSFLTTLELNDRGARLLAPGLVVADYLLTNGLLTDSSPEFQQRLAKFAWQSRGTSDPKRLIWVASIVSAMLEFGGQVQLDCLRYCLTLLISGYSKVRVHTAEQLYAAIMTYQTEMEDNLAAKCQEDELAPPSQLGDSPPQPPPDTDGGTRTCSDLNYAMMRLSDTNWAEPLEKVRPIRDDICKCFMIKM